MTNMQILQDQIVRTMDDSDTSTHLLPATLSFCVVGVKLSISSCDMKFDPPPNMISLHETYRSVYQRIACVMTQSSS